MVTPQRKSRKWTTGHVEFYVRIADRRDKLMVDKCGPLRTTDAQTVRDSYRNAAWGCCDAPWTGEGYPSVEECVRTWPASSRVNYKPMKRWSKLDLAIMVMLRSSGYTNKEIDFVFDRVGALGRYYELRRRFPDVRCSQWL